MTRFMGYDNGEYENRNYAIYDLSKSEKTKEDFLDNENDCYDLWAFMDYLEENNCILSCDKVVELLNEQQDKIQRLEKENQRVYGIIEDGGVLLTEKQLLDVIGEDKCDMFFREQETSNKLQEIKADAKTALLIIKAMQPLPFKISISEAKSLIRLSENVGELLDTEGD